MGHQVKDLSPSTQPDCSEARAGAISPTPPPSCTSCPYHGLTRQSPPCGDSVCPQVSGDPWESPQQVTIAPRSPSECLAQQISCPIPQLLRLLVAGNLGSLSHTEGQIHTPHKWFFWLCAVCICLLCVCLCCVHLPCVPMLSVLCLCVFALSGYLSVCRVCVCVRVCAQDWGCSPMPPGQQAGASM